MEAFWDKRLLKGGVFGARHPLFYKAFVKITFVFGKPYKMLSISKRINHRMHHGLKDEMEFFEIAVFCLKLKEQLVFLVGYGHELTGDEQIKKIEAYDACREFGSLDFDRAFFFFQGIVFGNHGFDRFLEDRVGV